ncbi:hypothetical protein WR25_05352 [Diploscapter pachys]|uniref:Integrator complex subunit 5 C-terminal domain-containing protein n=1 Tax=Diploscapter pachys TaxID=2018661 RepID=A0A2A2K9V8_9BILA|nr:hypothetical protein WR25_05352 [Diploscapter pachys]
MNPSTSTGGDYSESPASPGAEIAEIEEIQEPDEVQSGMGMDVDERQLPDSSNSHSDPKVLLEEDAEENRHSPDICIRIEDGHDAVIKIYEGPEWDNIYKAIDVIRAAFRKVALLGDVAAVYRNRPIWTSHSYVDLVKPALDAYNLVPSSRSAVYNYTGLLIHETAHQFVLKKENPQFGVDYSTVELTACELLKLINRTCMEAKSETVPLEILQWCCNLASELSQHNTGRPCTSKARGPDFLLELFRSCPPIEQLISLLDLVIDNLLGRCPESCMKVLFDASRSGSHFIWIWLHIAATFPGQIVEHLFTIGSEQFKTYVDNVRKQTKAKVLPAALETLHEDYRIKFVSLSDVFNFLMHRQNMELKNLASRMIKASLEQDPKNEVYEDLNFAFFFKLVTCSVNTLRFLVLQNSDLVTVLNIYRGIRQLQSLDKRILLSSMPYFDFILQIIHALDARSLALALKAIVRIAFDPNVFEGMDEQSAGHIQLIKSGAYSLMDPIVSLMMKAVHNSEGISQSSYEPIGEFARGTDLQLLIDAVNREQQWSPVIIRYLHVLSTAYGELKAAEISIRFLISIKEPAVLTVFMAYLKAITPFYHSTLETMYSNFSGLLTLIENDYRNCGREISTLQLVNNLCLMLDWEISCDVTSPIKYFRIFPAENLDELFTTLFSRIMKEIDIHFKEDNRAGSDALILATNRFLVALSLGVTKTSTMSQRRYIHFQVRSAVKVFVQLASYLYLVLENISRDRPNSMPLFDDTLLAVSSFITFEALSPSLHSFIYVFTESFTSSCLLNNEKLFGETVNLNGFNSNEANRNAADKDEESISLLDTLNELSKKTRLIDLKNSGVLPRKRKRAVDEVTVDAHLRAIVFVESLNLMCKSQIPKMVLKMSKHAANVLLNALCHEGIELDIQFHEWDTEKELISRHLKVVKRLEQSAVCLGLCDVLSHFPTFVYCLPLLKSLLACVINQFETNPKSIPENCYDRLDLFTILAQQSSLLPAQFNSIPHLMQRLSNAYHAYLVLLEVWKFYQDLSLSVEVVDMHISSLEQGERHSIIANARLPKMDTIRWVIQADINRLAPMFSKFFPTELSQLASEIDEIASP